MDELTFEALFRTYYAPLVRYAMGLVDSRDVARDLVQDTFLAIWESRWESRDDQALPAPPAAYLYTAVRNRALKHLRHERVVRRYEQHTVQALRDEAYDAVAPDTTDGAASDREIDVAVRQALAALPDRAREAFLLYRERGLSHKEIAETMGVSVRTVETHVRRAVLLLREALAQFR